MRVRTYIFFAEVKLRSSVGVGSEPSGDLFDSHGLALSALPDPTHTFTNNLTVYARSGLNMADMPGFFRAPVVKGLCAITGAAFSIVAWGFKAQMKGENILSQAHLFSPLRWIAGIFLFKGFGEVLVGLTLLYNFRVLERKMGSVKFASYVLVSTVLGITVQLAFLVTLSSSHVASGPYVMIFSLFMQYFAHVPKLVPRYFRVFGIDFSDKSFTYVLGGQLLWNRGLSSFASGFAGILVGVVYSSEIFQFHKWRIPVTVASFFQSKVLPWFGSADPVARRAQPRQERRQQPFAGGRNITETPLAAESAVPAIPGNFDEMVTVLTGMGFSREQSEAALRAGGFDLNIAVEALLAGH